MDELLPQQQYDEILVGQLREQVNNVMAALQLLTPLVRERGEEKHGQYLAIANQSLYRLLRTMGNVEFMQKVQSQEQSFRPVVLDMAGLCRALCRQVEPLAAMAGTPFQYEEGKASVLMAGEPALLRRMVLNLISTMLQAAGIGGQAGLRLACHGERVILTIWNIAGEHPGRARSGLEVSDEGADLGAVIARHIAALHRGSIVFEPQERGGRAVVSLPVGDLSHQEALHTPRMDYDPMGGFSPVLVELADVLPYQAFTPEDVE